MNGEKIRVLVVLANPQDAEVMLKRTSELGIVEVVGVVHNRNAAIAQVETLQPDVMVVDLMLPGYRSIDLVRKVKADHPRVRILSAVPADPPHDRIMLAAESGALGFVCQDVNASEFTAAIQQVHRGEPWLPLQQTYEVLQDGAGELAVTEHDRRSRLTEVLMGLIPLTGLVAAMTAFLWRDYWGAIGVRVADLGIDPTSRMVDMLAVFLVIIGVAGPLLFARPWVKAISKWIDEKPDLARIVGGVRGLRLGKLPVGRLLINFWVAWVLLLLLILSVTLLLTRIMPLIMVILIGPSVAIILIANMLELDDSLPNFLHLPHLESWRVLGFLGLVMIVFMLALGAEVHIIGPDLRADGLHGILAPKVLGLGAKPVMLYDLNEKNEPLGALYLGGNADLYVLYDPCAEVVRLVPVGASRVELIERVDCRSP